MGTWHDIESMCKAIKHVPENVDFEEVRVLLRRVQYFQDAFEPFRRPDTMTLFSSPDGGYTVSLTAYLSSDQYSALLEQMAGES